MDMMVKIGKYTLAASYVSKAFFCRSMLTFQHIILCTFGECVINYTKHDIFLYDMAFDDMIRLLNLII